MKLEDYLFFIVWGHSCQKGANLEKKVSFDFTVALYSINAPDIPKNFAK